MEQHQSIPTSVESAKLGHPCGQTSSCVRQAGRCEAALLRTRIELAAIRTAGSEASVSSIIESLLGTIHRAKEVQDEFEKFGY